MSGYSLASCAAMRARSAFAWATVTPGFSLRYIPGIVILAFIKPSVSLDLLLVLNRYPKLWREKVLRAVEVLGRYPDNGIG